MTYADTSEPIPSTWMSVSALTEFVFCPRAGLLASESEHEADRREKRARLDFSLPYSVPELERSLHRHLNRIWLLGSVSLAALALGGYALWSSHNLAALGAAAVLLAVAGPISRQIEFVRRLARLRAVAKSREARTPDLTTSERQNVDWFELLADDWTSAPNHEPFRDETLALAGSPWRTLRRGSVTVPVFKMIHWDADADGPKIFPQHVVRMAAYCRLIETCEAHESPCGIVLFGDSYRGVTLPNDASARRLFDEALAAARQRTIDTTEEQLDPSAPPPEVCRGCPWGAPREYRQGATEISLAGDLVPVYGSVAVDRRLYHSQCGDRFAWTPPHEFAQRLGLPI